MDRYLQNLECFCVKGVTSTCPAGGELDATMTVDAVVAADLEAASFIEEDNAHIKTTSVDLNFLASVSSKLSATLGIDAQLDFSGELQEDLVAEYSLKQQMESTGELSNIADKIHGDFSNNGCIEKLYPSGSLPIDPSFTQFVGNFPGKNLHSHIDEGVYQGILIDRGSSVNVSDDDETFIRPDSDISTEGTYQYKCSLSEFNVSPKESRLRMRVSAPTNNHESSIAPMYNVYDIKLLDPNDNIVIKYEDFSFRGDSTDEYTNYTTYSLAPTYNAADLYDWERRDTPLFHEKKNYSLTFSLEAISLDDPFDDGYSSGFEENRTESGPFPDPTENFKLSALEICNSGEYGPRPEDFVNVYIEVDNKGRRLERSILPSFMPTAEYDTTIWPSLSGVWSDNWGNSNLDSCGSKKLVGALRDTSPVDYITFDSMFGGGIADSGKLILKFSTGHSDVTEITKGAFHNRQFDQGNEIWWKPSGAFDTENHRGLNQIDNIIFDVESITLKVVAKKAPGTRDYVLDVVGYSDDKLLNVTSPSGGFIQDPSGVWLNDRFVSQVGNYPVLSGHYGGEDFAIGGTAISELDDYYEASGNDHYKLIQYPWVTGTDFQLYEVPLVIIDEQVKVGLGRDYSFSTLFEHLYLDIFPLPSGASISHISVDVRYRPQNGLNLHVQGGNTGRLPAGRSEGAMYPNVMGSIDDVLNAGSGYGPLSAVTDVPHRYSSPSTIKTNYARRWRGVEGTVRGPYDPDMFGFGFENPVMDYPFVSGYFKFDHMDGRYVKSSFLGEGFGQSSGLFTTTPSVYHNIGWRYTADTSNGLFQNQLPGYTGINKTSDWTSLSNGTVDFTGDPLYGKIADAFDRAVRVSQHTQNIKFEDVDVSDGFSVFLRFTPDNTVSGVGYNLFESGVLVSRWTTPNNMDFALGYNGGKLTAYAQEDNGNIIQIKDDVDYNEYTYPLNVMVTYTDDNKLRLYADNEASGDWNVLRNTSAAFTRNSVDTDIVVGWSEGSGVGMNMLVSEIGLSSGNILESKFVDKTFKQVNADKFLENSRVQYLDPGYDYTKNRYKLWDRVNEDTYNDWQIGAFKYCPFGPAFDQWQLRPNTEQIVFEYCCDGVPYIPKVSRTLPNFVLDDKASVAYHSQLENDFLRFHLSDVPNRFESVQRRITKNIPNGYKFSERALVVESVINHTSSGEISWQDCAGTMGPKLIVSLYTKSKESYWNDENPYGLVNRKVHYIEPSSCIMRLDTTFDYEDLCEETETWTLFDRESTLNEFTEKYHKDDVNQMFVQYDLVYPTGDYTSKLELHSSHVRMEDANVDYLTTFDSGILYTSGAYHAGDSLNLVAGENPEPINQYLDLLIGTPLILGSEPSGLYLYSSGNFVGDGSMSLFTPQHSGVEHMNLFTSGGIWFDHNDSMNLALPEVLGVDSNYVYLYMLGEPGTNANDSLKTFIHGANNSGIYSLHNLYLFNNGVTGGAVSGDLNMYTFGAAAYLEPFSEADMPLFISTPQTPATSMPLYTTNYLPTLPHSGSMNLYTSSLSAALGMGSSYSFWYNKDYGTGIEIKDEPNASIPVSDEIRGVDLTAYGSCEGDSPSKAIDQVLSTDCTVWRDEVCNEGGIFRAKATYTNIDVGYENNYYGIRKYTGLIPGISYEATLNIKTGHTDPIATPRNFEDWEYGICGPNWDADGCCTEDCDQDIAYSGVKLIGDESNLPIEPDFVLASGRSPEDNYGAAVSVKDNLMGISAPNITIPDLGGVEASGAGAVFLYRRDEDVAGKKAAWRYEDVLMLPSGYRKDYVEKVIEDVFVFEDLSIDGKKWQIGQEGRQFGESLDIASSGGLEVAVVGAPKAQWFRQFEEVLSSGIGCGSIIITDQFDYEENRFEINRIAGAATYANTLYKYFSAPWNGDNSDNEFQPAVKFKLIVVQPVNWLDPSQRKELDIQEPWLHHVYVPRLDDQYYLDSIDTDLNVSVPQVYNQIASGFYDAFFSAFPSGQAVRDREEPVYNGVPAIMGRFKDNSNSFIGAVSRVQNSVSYNLFDEVENFYNAYTLESGVFNQETDIDVEGLYKTYEGAGDNWASTTKSFIENDLLNTGVLINEGNLIYLTSGVGQKWNKLNAPEFQLPPNSGGRAFIFEKERNNWNCVQVVSSPNRPESGDNAGDGDLGDEDMGISARYVDRFGHAVAVSKNGDIVSIGSPFTDSPCRIYERSQEEINKVYNRVREWCVENGKTDAVAAYDAQEDVTQAQIAAYDALSMSDRFAYRNDNKFWNKGLPQQYRWTFEYTYQDIQYTGTNAFLAGTFAPTSRLGWSTSVSDDGSSVAFGAPTDSFNEFDDVNVWGTGLKTWASYNYAGAVRMFESRRYHPHSGVVEFGIFGNLDRNLHEQERNDGLYDQMGIIFGEAANGDPDYKAKYFRRTEFSEIEIPQDAGLAFIMTPELDAASDEIVQNIKDWLALGDRNLVLVGNDPVWEENGAYAKSNDIVNKLLEKLDVDMRIFPAETRERSLPECADVLSSGFNITKAKTPRYASPTYLGRDNYYAKGVGDIRIDVSKHDKENYYHKMNCPEGITEEKPVINSRCEMPIQHHGDLRAEWLEQCTKTNGKTEVITYSQNWPLQYGNHEVGCDSEPTKVIKTPGFDPIPVLTTREYIPDEPWYIPATSGKQVTFTYVYEWVVTDNFDTRYTFAETQEDTVAFSITEDENSNVAGVHNAFVQGGFTDPDPTNGRDGLLQSFAQSKDGQQTVPYFETIYSEAILGVMESGRFSNGEHNNSKFYMMATQWSEDDASRGVDGRAEATKNNDQNTFFYLNMIHNNLDDAPVGQHLGGWTGRTSLEDAYFQDGTSDVFNDGYSLAGKLNVEITKGGGSFTENVVYTGSQNIPDSVNFIWIAHPAGRPSVDDISRIKRWMDKGDKKVIITYNGMRSDDRQDVAANIDYLCQELGITSRPMLEPVNQVYHVVGQEVGVYDRFPPHPVQDIIASYDPNGGPVQYTDQTIDAFAGYTNGYTYNPEYSLNTQVDGLHFSNSSDFLYNNRGGSNNASVNRLMFVPISGGEDFEKMIWYDYEIKERRSRTENTTGWFMDDKATLSFDTIQNTGYRVFINYVNEDPNEKFSICGEFKNVSFDPDPGNGGFGGGLGAGGGGFQDKCQIPMHQGPERELQTTIVDLRAISNDGGFQWFMPYKDGINPNMITEGVVPRSVRFVSMSGCPLPIDEEVFSFQTSGKVLVDVIRKEEWIVDPAKSGVIPGYWRPTSELSERYCTPGNHEDCADLGKEIIENGPVVVAEQPETFSSFPAGENRSRIIVVADSTMLQGECPRYRMDALAGNQEFIRSLYPDSPTGEFEGNAGRNFNYSSSDQRFWSFSQKIRSPEAGSASKYYAISGHNLENNMIQPLFGAGGETDVIGGLIDWEDSIVPQSLSRPAEITDPFEIAEAKRLFGEQCLDERGMLPAFSGDYLHLGDYGPYLYPFSDQEQDYLYDAKIKGGLPDLMKVNGKDYLDLDFYYERSGCLGDLFGYAVDLSDDKLIVGSPFNAFYSDNAPSGGIVEWSEVTKHYLEDGTISGVAIAEDGGAGSAFVWHKTNQGKNILVENLGWEFNTKVKPSSTNIGLTGFDGDTLVSLAAQKGDHNLIDPDEVQRLAKRSDNFGYSVAIDCDMLAVGAPNHDFETLHHHIYSGSVDPNGLNSAFLRKSFDGAFDIPLHSYYDLGTSGVRIDDFERNSGEMILNNGAVFNYRYSMVDIPSRKQEWGYAEKLYAQGYNDRTRSEFNGPALPPNFVNEISYSGGENDRFGSAVSIDRAYRGDSDYTLVAGSPKHTHATSGLHHTGAMAQAGSAYTFDAMLRGQTPMIPNGLGWMDVGLFGSKISEQDTLFTRVYQNETGGSIHYKVTGVATANENGDVFLEVSGYDPSTVGFIAHRPYVESVKLTAIPRDPVESNMPLVISGVPQQNSNKVPLYIPGPDKDMVYNTMNTYVFGIDGYSSGNMNMFVAVVSGDSNSSLNLNMTSTQTIGNLDLRIRGY